MKRSVKALDFLDFICERVSKITMWVFIALMLTMTYEVVMRYIFRSPTMWSYDMTYLLNSISVVFGMAWVYKIKGHVKVDIIYNRYSEKMRNIMDLIFVPLLFLIPWAFILYRMMLHVMNSIAIREVAITGTLMPPIYPFKTWLFVGFLLLFLQVLSEYIRQILNMSVKKGSDLDAS